MPSRVHDGQFFALPQSPQLFKQLLMIAGMDRYFQIARCFRDEDLRADRQPEFTQVDVEISFATPDIVFGLIEPVIKAAFAEIGVDVPLPLPRMPYSEAMGKYGSDKPDLRFGLEIAGPDAGVRGDDVRAVPRGAGREGRRARPGRARRGALSRKEVETLCDEAVQFGGLVTYARRQPDGNVQSPLKNQVGEEAVVEALKLSGATADDALLLAAGPADKIAEAARAAAAASRQEAEPDRPGEVGVHLGRRLPAVRVGRRRAALLLGEPPVHGAARGRRPPARHRAGRGALAGLRHRPQRHGDRRRQHPYPRSGAAGEDLHACSA